jgi:hypothetical protein
LLFIRSADAPDAVVNFEFLEAEDHCSRAVAHQSLDLSQRTEVGIVCAFERLRTHTIGFKFRYDRGHPLFLLITEVAGFADENSQQRSFVV